MKLEEVLRLSGFTCEEFLNLMAKNVLVTLMLYL